ncbi:uncharacterized protein LOC135501002 [Lineus longissimus]|uniref:uncharacterized protein LOC135501002 n=1 Tax=Lineus longissimus TaxID=88925 RepID=UPI00315CFC46
MASLGTIPELTVNPSLAGHEASINGALAAFREELDRYYQYRKIIAESYDAIRECLDMLFETYTDDSTMGWIKSHLEEEAQPVETVLTKDPIILVSGQVNCGKSSFINELLQRNIVPVEEHPCTSRIVRIRHSKEEYYQVIGTQGGQIGKRHSLKTSELREEVKLKEGKREAKGLVEDVVEIGLDHPMLASGLQIVDTPGLSENVAMDTVVSQCLDGVLQVLFYVIDGNTSLRVQDIEFIAHVTARAPDMKIIYVCNKCEEDNMACSMDAASDVNSSEDEDEHGGPPFGVIPKGQLAFRKLKNFSLISENDGEDSDVFYQLSCSMLKRARKRGFSEENRFTAEFRRLVTSVMGHMRECLQIHLLEAIVAACGIAARVFDFLVGERCTFRGTGR